MDTQKNIQGSSNRPEEGGKRSGPSRHGKGSDSPRGFAAMHPDLQREIASKGGRAAHEQGTAHEFTTDEAREAGRKSHQGAASRSKVGGSSR
jgi:general stress protein YciG